MGRLLKDYYKVRGSNDMGVPLPRVTRGLRCRRHTRQMGRDAS